MPLNKDLREFVALLNSNEVEYLVVGAFAVAHYGYPRYTGDLDLFFRASAGGEDLVVALLPHKTHNWHTYFVTSTIAR